MSFFLLGVQILHIRLDSKIALNSDFKLNAIKHNTNASQHNTNASFDNLMHCLNDRDLDAYSVSFDLFIRCVKEFIRSAETEGE